MKNEFLITCLLAAIFSAGCSNHETVIINNQKIDTQIVLRIGKVAITAYEMDKNINLSTNFINQATNGSNVQLINSNKDFFIDKTYFLADAYEKGYNRDKYIDSIVEGAARSMISQSNGLLEKEISRDNKISDKEIATAIEKSKSEFYIEYLKFKDKNSAYKYLQGNAISTFSDFKSLINNVDLLEVAYKKDTITWPFKGYWGHEDEIFALKNNDVSPLLKLYNGYYLIHIEKIIQSSQPVASASQMKMQLELARRLQTKDMLNFKAVIYASPVLNGKAIYAFAKRISNYAYGPNHLFAKKDFVDILDRTMLTYTSPTRQPKAITISDFIDYYNTLFLKPGINSIDDVSRTLSSIYFTDYAYADGVKRGITSQPKFILDKNNFKNNIIYSVYMDKELANKSPIQKDEIIKMYNSLKPKLVQAKNVIASIYYFNNQSEALRKKFNLKTDTLKFRGLTKTDKHILLNYKSKLLIDTLKKAVFDLSLSNPARMIELNNQYIVIVKEREIGSRVRSLTEVKELVTTQIKNQRLKKNQQLKLTELKSKYRLIINLTNQYSSAMAMNN